MSRVSESILDAVAWNQTLSAASTSYCHDKMQEWLEGIHLSPNVPLRAMFWILFFLKLIWGLE